MSRIIVALLLLTSVASAQEPQPVSEEAKILALKLGYLMNDNSMVRWGSIDLPAELAKAKAAPDPAPALAPKKLRGRP